ncbi:type II CAAX endopeptidase family protein [Romboutsia sedimentorum]|uniref:CPBP family intramembrane glutamic endopeptidase n=1 Tax=Romboutsia sedimentorum TaxID=1368474 RepID=UPI0024DE80C9|nr:type II CAAX endopeptidase family protein [Romboutsia sedimentorum]MDK2587266.1 type II CAAX endopeptidase family protein [Romboutsia sedimentorum]
MSTDIKTIKQEIKYFLLINFGLIAFISIFLFISASSLDSSKLIHNFSVMFMYIPAFSVIVVLKKFSNYEFTSNVEQFLRVFAIFTLVRIVTSIVDVFVFKSTFISSLIDTFISLYLVVLILSKGSEFKVLNLCLTKNFKKVIFVVLIFFLVTIGRSYVGAILDGSSTVSMKVDFLAIVKSFIINFCFGFNLFFGEEFGWRYFLQPRLQKLYGKRPGALILGFIWGIWHLPLCFTLYNPKTPVYGVIHQVAFCMLLGVFFGYAYMKTENVWAPILIHLANNGIIMLGESYESVITIDSILIGVVANAIFFLPFLFAKEYKSNNVEESSTLDL